MRHYHPKMSSRYDILLVRYWHMNATWYTENWLIFTPTEMAGFRPWRQTNSDCVFKFISGNTITASVPVQQPWRTWAKYHGSNKRKKIIITNVTFTKRSIKNRGLYRTCGRKTEFVETIAENCPWHLPNSIPTTKDNMATKVTSVLVHLKWALISTKKIPMTPRGQAYNRCCKNAASKTIQA